MAKIRQSNLDNSIITGLTELTQGNIASTDLTLVYDASTGTLKKITQNNFLNFPTISSVSPTSVVSGDGTGNYTFTITGVGFTSASASLVNASGGTVNFDSVTVDSDTQITGVIAKSSLPGSGEPYDVKVTAATGLIATLENQINIDQSPAFVTASGSLGSQRLSMNGLSVNATDPESAGNVTFELQSGSLPPGISLTNTGADGGTATFTGTISPLASSNTVYNFVLRAVDAASNTSSRAFSFTALGPQYQTFTSSGTFTVEPGLTSVDVLVVGGGGSGGFQHGGGGGAGGLVFVPGLPITPGVPISVTVGCGGAGAPGSAPTFPNLTGQDSVFGTLTAKGGGVGGSGPQALASGDGPDVPGSGGSGGGSGYNCAYPSGGTATQPTQPGNSGAYGFGNAGGPSTGSGGGRAGAGGGGAGAAGGGTSTASGGQGGVGKAYTIADGTTPVYYAGGGGGSNHASPSSGGTGGQGGGGNAGYGPIGQNGAPPSAAVAAQNGAANKGGGGGGAHHAAQQTSYSNTPACQVRGGKGIVIVKY